VLTLMLTLTLTLTLHFIRTFRNVQHETKTLAHPPPDEQMVFIYISKKNWMKLV